MVPIYQQEAWNYGSYLSVGSMEPWFLCLHHEETLNHGSVNQQETLHHGSYIYIEEIMEPQLLPYRRKQKTWFLYTEGIMEPYLISYRRKHGSFIQKESWNHNSFLIGENMVPMYVKNTWNHVLYTSEGNMESSAGKVNLKQYLL